MMKVISRKEAKEQGLKRYFTGKPCKQGHISERGITSGCLVCSRLHSKKNYEENKEKRNAADKRYYEENKEKAIATKKEYYEKNKESIRKKRRAIARNYYKKNRDSLCAYAKMYREENEGKVKARKRAYWESNKEKVTEFHRKWKQDNPMQVFIRRALGRIEKGAGVNSKRTMAEIEQEIGYTQEAFKQHIESRWLDGMGWDNRKDWHIDHIIPVSQFIKNDITDAAIVNALDNLQPLWAIENLSKQDKPVPQAEFDAFIKRIQAKKAA